MRLNDKTKREKDAIREILRKRDGDGTRHGTKCFVDNCTSEDDYYKETGKDFDICHLDDNPENWDMQNLFLATHKCNCQLTPRGLGRFNHLRTPFIHNSLQIKKKTSISTQVQINEDNLPTIRYAEFAKGYIADPLINEELERIFELHQEIDKKELINALVNISKLSPERIKPRLDGWCNGLNGHLEEFDKEISPTEIKKFIRKRT